MDAIYLDHNATTPIHPEVLDTVQRTSREVVANPASQHRLGQKARQQLEDAREAIAAIFGARLTGPRPCRLIFTSGGTEANNLAILGICRAQRPAAVGHLIVSAIEHPSVMEPAEHLLEQGWGLDALGVDGQGVVCVERLASLLKPDTCLVSVMLANHDTGVVQPVAELSEICSRAGVPLHTDAIQAVGKIPVDFEALGTAALSIAAHKFRGPLGIGALLLRHETPLAPLVFGGSQQSNLRPGTESVPLAVGMLAALEIWHREADAQRARQTALRQRFENTLARGLPSAVVHGSAAPRLPNTSNVAFPGIDGQVLLLALDMAGVACSVGAACSSGSSELSPTLRAMGLPQHLVASSLRFSLGSSTTEAQIDEAAARIVHVCRELSPSV